jgi:hypothetical protein
VLDKYGGPVSATFDITDYLDGWSYRHLWDRLDSSERKALRDGPLAPITVIHTFRSDKAEASWNHRTRTLKFYGFPEAMTFNRISEVAERYREIPTSARHELQHVTQQAIGAMTGSGWGGLPKRRLRRPESIEEQVFQYNRSGEVLDYVDSDVEYQTKLTDAVESWDRSVEPDIQRWISRTGLSERDQREFMKFYVRVYVGASVDPQRDFSRLLSRLPEYEEPWDQPDGRQSAFFLSLKRADSAKWRNAVGTFYKEIARTTRLAGDSKMASSVKVAARWLKQSKNLPKNVERYVQEGKDQGLDEGEAWAVAWSRYCKYKNPDSPHCKKDSPSDYLQNQGKKQASEALPFDRFYKSLDAIRKKLRDSRDHRDLDLAAEHIPVYVRGGVSKGFLPKSYGSKYNRLLRGSGLAGLEGVDASRKFWLSIVDDMEKSARRKERAPKRTPKKKWDWREYAEEIEL